MDFFSTKWQLGWLKFWESEEENEDEGKRKIKRLKGLFHRKLLQRKEAQQKMDRLQRQHSDLLEEIAHARAADQDLSELMEQLEKVTNQGVRLSEQIKMMSETIRDLRQQSQVGSEL